MNNWSIGIRIYKMKSGKYFILDIPKEMVESGYLEECYEENSNLFKEFEIDFKLHKEEYGVFSLFLKPIDKTLSYNKILEEAKEGKWNFFKIENYIRTCQ